MPLLEQIRTTDQMLHAVNGCAPRLGMKDAAEFLRRIKNSDHIAGTQFLEMAERLWVENREVLQAFYRHHFHQLSRDQQRSVAYTTALSFLDRSAVVKAPDQFDLL